MSVKKQCSWMRSTVVSCLSVSLGLSIASDAHAQLAAPRGPDFDGDGRSDMVVGSPGYKGYTNQPNTAPNGGQINSYRGDHTSTAYDPGDPLRISIFQNERFGTALAWGKFGSDRYSDLFVGVPWDIDAGGGPIGAVFVYEGMAAPGNIGQIEPYRISRKDPNMAGIGNPNDLFGYSLAAGDFNGDGYDDLAIGAPGQSTEFPAGSVHVILGTAQGYSTDYNKILKPVGGAAGDNFGYALTSGDFNCDGTEDLAIGAPYVNISGQTHAGKVYLSYGSKPASPLAGGLSSTLVEVRQGANLGTTGMVQGAPNTGDEFGSSLAAGNFAALSLTRAGVNRPCIGLAVGVPGENVGGAGARGGAVYVFAGTGAGITASGLMLLHQDAAGGPFAVQDRIEANDEFGSALAITRANTDANDDLIVGVPGEGSGAGAVHVFRGASAGAGFWPGDDVFWTQNTAGIPGAVESGDAFGAAVGSSEAGVVIVGSPFENITASSVAYVDTGMAIAITTNASVGIVGARQCDLRDYSNYRLVADAEYGGAITAARPAFVR